MPPQHQSVPQSLPQSHSQAQSSANPYANVGMGTAPFDPYTMDMNQYQNMNSLAMGQDHTGGHGSAYDSSGLGMQMEFFRQPLPFDPELLQSMQSSLTELDATTMPGQFYLPILCISVPTAFTPSFLPLPSSTLFSCDRN